MSTIAFVNSAEEIRFLDDVCLPATIIHIDNSPKKKRGERSERYRSRNEFVSDDEIYEIYKKAMRWLKEWSCKPICDGKNFKELFTYKGISLWWFIDFWLFYHEIHRMTVQDIVLNLHIIDAITKKETPTSMYIIDDGSAFSDITAHYCSTKGIPIIKKQRQRAASVVRRSKPYILEFLKYGKYRFRHAASRLIASRQGRQKKTDVLLIGLTSQLQDDPARPGMARDHMLKPIMDHLDEMKIPYAYTDRDFTRSLGIHTMIRTDGIPAEHFMDRKISKDAKAFQKKCAMEYERLKGDIANSLIYEKIPLWPLLEKRFDFIFAHKISEAVRWVEAFVKMIDTYDPHCLIIIDETGISGKAAVVAGHLRQKLVIGLQHGAISPLAFEYMHLKGEIQENLDIHAPFCPIPHKTAVYGKHTRDVLVNEGNYPEQSVTLTGQPRYDVIKELRMTLDKKKVCRDLDIDPEKKIILVITQPCKDRIYLAQEIFESIRDAGSCQVVLKPHPREADYHRYNEIAKEKGIDIKLCTQDLFKLLFIADIIIQRDSTVGIEAMLFEKPLICAYLFCLDIARTNQYLESGCRLARNTRELRRQVTEALNGIDNDRYLRAQNQWVEAEAYNRDGCATRRVADLLALKR